jgi:hypothetical protein
MRGPHRAIAVGDERPQVSALPHRGHARYAFVRDGLKHCATLVLRHPLRPAAGTRRWGVENKNTPAASSVALAVSRRESNGHAISTLCRNPLQTRLAVGATG